MSRVVTDPRVFVFFCALESVWLLGRFYPHGKEGADEGYCSLYIEAPDGTEMRARLSVPCAPERNSLTRINFPVLFLT